MGDVRYEHAYARIQDAEDRTAAMRALEDDEVIAALAAASRKQDPLLANVLATEAQNRTARTRRILASMGDAVLVTRWPEGGILDVNPAGERAFGWPADELKGKPLGSLFADPARFREFSARVDDALAHGEVVQCESELRRRNGDAFPAEHTVTRIRDAFGEPVGVVNLVRDVTERKRAQAALRESEERYRAVAEHAAIGMALVNLDGRFLQVNQALADILGYDRETLLEKRFQDITHPADLDADLAQARRLAAGLIRSYDMEKRYIRKDGHVVWVLLTGSVVRNERGEAVYFIAQVQDITERKAAERRLATQNGVARVLAEARTVDEAARGVLHVFCETLGWDVGEFWRLDRQAGVLRLAQAWYGPSPAAEGFRGSGDGMALEKGVGLAGTVWEKGRAIGMEDVTSEASFVRQPAAHRAGLHAGFGLPVRAGDRTVGAMVFFSPDMRAFDEDLRRVMESIGGQVGLFMERAQAQETIRKLVEAAPDATVVIDASGCVTLLNARAERLFGYARDEILGHPVEVLLPERLRGRHVLHRAGHAQGTRARPADAGLDILALRKDGVEVPVEITLAPLDSEEGQLTVASIRPVLELRRPPTARPIPAMVRGMRAASRAAAVFPALVGILVLLGWASDTLWLKTILPGAPRMVANTALGLVLAGLSLWLLQEDTPLHARRGPRRAARVLALLVALLGGLTIFEYLAGASLGIDQLLVRDVEGAAMSPIPGRPSAQTALAFLFLGAGLLLLDARGRKGARAAQLLALGGATLALFSLSGYALGVPFLYLSPGQRPYTGMAIHTSLSILALAAGILAAHPTRGLASVLVSDSAGGALARRLAPVALALPLLVGALVLAVGRVTGVGRESDVAFHAVLTIHLAGLVIWITSRSLDRQDRERRRVETLFRGLLLGAPDATVITDAAGSIRYVSQEAERMFGYDADELVGLPIEALMPERFRAGHVLHRAGYSKEPRTRPMGADLALYAQRKDGTEFPVEISLSPTETEEGLLVTAAIRDATRRQDAARRTQAEGEGKAPAGA